MGILFVLLFIQAISAEFNITDEFIDWHENVGIKNGERIKFMEDNLIQQRIVGGAIADSNDHPYLAGLIIDVGMSSPSVCGGSIITPTRILTAAHCYSYGRIVARRMTAVLGSQFLFHGGVRIAASAIAVHPRYDYRTLANDIAVLILPVNITFSDRIQPIALANEAWSDVDFTNRMVTASGYGRYSDFGTPTTNTFTTRNVRLWVISNELCQLFHGIHLLDSNICTCGRGGVGICQGDSGGPLTITTQGQEVLIGVSSFVSQAGCEQQHPSAYVRITSYISWIRQHV